MAKKSNIDFSITAPASHRYRAVNGLTAGPWSTSQTSIATMEVRKLIRDTSSPTSKREKPYQNKHVFIQYPQGNWIRNANIPGTAYTECIGCPGPTDQGQLSRGFYMEYKLHGQLVYSPKANDWPLNPDLLSQAEVKAYAALRNKYKELDSSSYLSFGLWFGERRETASLLRDSAVTFGRFVQGIRSMKSRDVIKAIMDFRADLKPGAVAKRVKRELHLMRNRLAKKQPGEVILRHLPKETLFTANRLVLAYNLGVSPMLHDLDAAYKALLQRVADPTSLRIKAKGWVDRHTEGSYVETSTRGFVKATTTVNNTLRHKVTFVCRPAQNELAILERAGLANVPSLLAELTGCSFIINYYWSILDYLKALSTPLAFEWEMGSYTVKVSHRQKTVIESTSQFGQLFAEGNYRHVELRRRLYGSTFPVPMPPLSFRGQDLNVDQAVNVTTVTIAKARKALGL